MSRPAWTRGLSRNRRFLWVNIAYNLVLACFLAQAGAPTQWLHGGLLLLWLWMWSQS
jgi:hypothetical protein